MTARVRDRSHPLIENHELAVAVDAVYYYGWAVIAVALLSVVVRQWIRASPSTRRTALPVWSLTGLILVLFVVGYLPISFEAAEAAGWVVDVAFLLTPFAFLAGLLGMRLDSVGVGRLAVDLAADPRPGRVRYLLARALRDPGLGIAFWVRDGSGYVDEAGLPISEPAWAGGRAVSRIDGDDAPLAMLALDPEVAEQHELIDAVGAVARLALENERLHAEVLAQLEEVRASRVRLVDAADAERRRVERNLHDGAQQRLVTLSLALGQAQSLVDDGDSELATTLADASEELRRALAELRELARGIHPTLLTEEGLVAAAESLAERSPIPVVVSSEVTSRLPPHVEATGYFLVAEALANIVRHAGASQAMVSFTAADGLLRVEVHDDGRGGADPSAGSGLRGLEDRVVALGGTLSIDSTPEFGTRVVAVLPCG